MAEQLKAGPMIVEKQRIFYISCPHEGGRRISFLCLNVWSRNAIDLGFRASILRFVRATKVEIVFRLAGSFPGHFLYVSKYGCLGLSNQTHLPTMIQFCWFQATFLYVSLVPLATFCLWRPALWMQAWNSWFFTAAPSLREHGQRVLKCLSPDAVEDIKD